MTREQKPVFICFKRLRDISDEMFMWVLRLTDLNEDENDAECDISDEFLEELLTICKFDIIRYDDFIIARFDSGKVLVKSLTRHWEYDEDFLPLGVSEVLSTLKDVKNSLRNLKEEKNNEME
jgi:hypothetical protein